MFGLITCTRHAPVSPTVSATRLPTRLGARLRHCSPWP